MKRFTQVWNWLLGDSRKPAEIEQERQFIRSVNQLKSLSATPGGGMLIDPEELRDQIIASREAYKDFVDPSHRRRTDAKQSPKSPPIEAESTPDCAQIITWRRRSNELNASNRQP